MGSQSIVPLKSCVEEWWNQPNLSMDRGDTELGAATIYVVVAFRTKDHVVVVTAWRRKR
jgi:hypothetical protein